MFGSYIYYMNIRDPDPTNNRNWVSNVGAYGSVNYIQCPEAINNKIQDVQGLEITTADNWGATTGTKNNLITFSGGVGFAFIGSSGELSDYTKNIVIFYYDKLTNRIYFKTDAGVQFSLFIVNIYMEFTMNNTFTV